MGGIVEDRTGIFMPRPGPESNEVAEVAGCNAFWPGESQ
jgi:hypothetical protein